MQVVWIYPWIASRIGYSVSDLYSKHSGVLNNNWIGKFIRCVWLLKLPINLRTQRLKYLWLNLRTSTKHSKLWCAPRIVWTLYEVPTRPSNNSCCLFVYNVITWTHFLISQSQLLVTQQVSVNILSRLSHVRKQSVSLRLSNIWVMYSGNFTSPLSLWRDLFITLDLEDFFSALTLNFAFLPWKLMVSHSQGICSLCPVFVVFCQHFCSQHFKFWPCELSGDGRFSLKMEEWSKGYPRIGFIQSLAYENMQSSILSYMKCTWIN